MPAYSSQPETRFGHWESKTIPVDLRIVDILSAKPYGRAPYKRIGRKARGGSIPSAATFFLRLNMNCDVCNQSCNAALRYNDYSVICNEYATLKAHWGYYSKNKDCMNHECILCEDCYDKVIQFIKGLGGKVRGQYYLISDDKFEV